jgi:hypothetical protein
MTPIEIVLYLALAAVCFWIGRRIRASLIRDMQTRVGDPTRPEGVVDDTDHTGTRHGRADTKKWPFERSFSSPGQMTAGWPQLPTDATKAYLATLPPDQWSYIYELGCLWGVGFATEDLATAWDAHWQNAD